MERCYIAMMRRLNHHRAEMKKKILEEQMDNQKSPNPQNMVNHEISFSDFFNLYVLPVNFRLRR